MQLRPQRRSCLRSSSGVLNREAFSSSSMADLWKHHRCPLYILKAVQGPIQVPAVFIHRSHPISRIASTKHRLDMRYKYIAKRNLFPRQPLPLQAQSIETSSGASDYWRPMIQVAHRELRHPIIHLELLDIASPSMCYGI